MVAELGDLSPSLGVLVDERAEQRGGQVYAYFDDHAVTFAELAERSRRVAGGLAECGVGSGDTVALLMANCPEYFELLIATARLGALAVPVNTGQVGEFLAHQLRESEAKVLCVDASLLDRVEPIANDLPDLLHVVVRHDVDPTGTVPRVTTHSVGDLFAGRPTSGVDARPGDPAAILFTSGTTGTSKGAVVSHRYLIVGAQTINEAWETMPEDVVYGAVPMFHFSGLMGVVLQTVNAGATAVLDKWFSLSATWDRVRKYEATGVVLVGPMLPLLWSLPPDERDAELPTRVMGCAPIPDDLIGKWEQRYGCKLMTMYGMTEAFPLAITTVNDALIPNAAGRPNPRFDVAIVDDDDQSVPLGQVGEIVCRPKFPHIMFEGYYKRPADTLERLGSLWFHTGDFGRYADDGILAFVDRKKDALRRRGENISSVELEASLLGHPAVADVAVIGVPSEVGEDDVKACVVLAPDAEFDPEEFISFARDCVPFFAVPRYVEVLDALPRNAVGRVLKFELRAKAFDGDVWDRDAPAVEVDQ